VVNPKKLTCHASQPELRYIFKVSFGYLLTGKRLGRKDFT
jgi:hypothetical protein